MFKNIDYYSERDVMKNKYGCDTMCTAKFLSSTIYLQTGETHSCYHPLPHKIPLDEIIENPSALHNTKHKKLRREEMLKGKKPKECNYCWRVEAMGEEHISDRIIKSKNETLLTPNAHEQILKKGWTANYNPTYLEISFGNECNMRCAYCHPKASSAWMKEMDLKGPFENAKHLQVVEQKIYEETDNPYVDAFWKWWPDLRKDLRVIRVTGGEPLLQQNVWKWLDMLSETDDCKEMIFQLNTNLNVKNKLVHRLIQKVDMLLKEKKIAKFAVFTSVESWGERAEYARNGLDCELFEQNLETLMRGLQHHDEHLFSGVKIMNTFNILSVTSYVKFLEKIRYWRGKLQKGEYCPKITFDIPHCTEPNQFSLVGLPDDFESYFEYITEYIEEWSWINNQKKYTKDHHNTVWSNYFSREEVKMWDRVISYWHSIVEQRGKVRLNEENQYLQCRAIDDARRNFILFIKATDKRRGTDFKTVFPEMSQYYDLCATLEDIKNIEYNNECKNYLMKDTIDGTAVEFHWDDDFVWQHPKLARSILNWRRIRNLPTKIYDKDVLQDEIGYV